MKPYRQGAMRMRLLPAVVLLVLASATALQAQGKTPPQPPPAPPPQQPAPLPPKAAPYEAQLMRLSELMGALHYLRGLCQAGDADAWRAKLSHLIASEGFSDDERARYAGAFNRGYRAFSESYRACNVAARETIRAYLAEGERIASDVHGRYAN